MKRRRSSTSTRPAPKPSPASASLPPPVPLSIPRARAPAQGWVLSEEGNLLDPFGGPWGRRASDNPALTGELLAHLQSQFAEGCSSQPSPASPSAPEAPPPCDDADSLNAYLKGTLLTQGTDHLAREAIAGRGAGKRHTIGASAGLLSPSQFPTLPLTHPASPGESPSVAPCQNEGRLKEI